MIHKKGMCFAFTTGLSRVGWKSGLTCFSCHSACLVQGQPHLQTDFSQRGKMTAWIYTLYILTHCQELDTNLAFFSESVRNLNCSNWVRCSFLSQYKERGWQSPNTKHRTSLIYGIFKTHKSTGVLISLVKKFLWKLN